ncbi:ABC transporter permease [Nonomuraea sp. KC401]|uniref:ABC transporter permease n=1 Tax=unclassified Nonomuraea TaxID=2593643 RepID=UPI0010FE6785|nr:MULTISPECIES: ABC transporter permease [unclassified Nonomuraea]NBE93782.1 ABC transporter permease [Nonomuraea sp. K271]TLF80707.1 ABC transporter permease [Nonomuraea sp. KC401]
MTGPMTGPMNMAATYRLATRLFWRDKSMVFASVVTPVGLAVGMPALMRNVTGVAAATHVFQGALALLLAITAFMNVTVVLAGRRDQLVLKRLRASRLTDAQILTGQIAGTATQTVVVTVLCTLAVHLVAGVPLPANPFSFAAVVIAGSAVLSLLGGAYTAAVPRAELAAAFTTPVFLVAGVSAGAMGPIPLPSWLPPVLDLLPTTAVVDAVRTGDLVVPLLILAGWTLAGLAAIRLWFRWEPRRS